MFSNYLIGLREGLEAALVVSILVAYLVKVGRRDRLPTVAAGVAVAVAVSAAFGALLTYTSTSLLSDFKSQEIFSGTLSLIAVGFVTWMVFWMRRTARGMRSALDGRLSTALQIGALAVALTAFLAVAREDWRPRCSSGRRSRQPAAPPRRWSGSSLGVGTAVVLAWLLYRRSVKLNLARFFTWTGAGLIVVAGGVLAYAVHDLQEGGVIGGLNTLAFDVSAQIPPGSWYATLLRGIFNFTPQTTVAQATAWVAYVVPVMTLFFRSAPAPTSTPSRAAEASLRSQA